MMRHTLIDKILKNLKKELTYSNRSAFITKKRGEGFDFSQLSIYTPDMDAKKIYWKSLAKGGEIQYKSYYEEKEIDIVVVCILSGSLCFGTPLTKHKRVLKIASVISYSAIKSSNRFFGFTFVSDKKFVIKASKSHKAVEKFLKESSKIDPLFTKIDESFMIDELFKSIRKKSLIFLIGDFLEEIDLSKLAKRHLLYAVVVRDRFEAEPRALGESILKDPQSGEELELFFDEKAASYYANRYKDHDKKLKEHFLKSGIDFGFFYSDEAFLFY